VARELSVDRADADAADRSFERRIGDVERGRCRVHREDVVLVLLVGGPRRDDDLDVVPEALRPQRSDRAVDETSGEDALLGGAALTSRERTGDLARRVEALLEVDGEREEVDTGPDRLRDRARCEDDCVAIANRHRAAGLLRVSTGLECEWLAVDVRGGLGWCHECFVGAFAYEKTQGLPWVTRLAGSLPAQTKAP